MTAEEKATWEFLFNTPAVSILKYGISYSDFVEAVTSDRKNAFIAGAEWQKEQMMKDAVEWMKNYVLNHDYIDIFEMESSFKIYMEGGEQ